MSPRRPTVKPPKHHYGGGGSASGSRAKGDHSHYGGVENPMSHPPARARPTPATGQDHVARPRPKPHQGTHGTTAAKKISLAREHATVQAFDAGTYSATIILARAPDASLSGIPVSRAISSGLLVAGATVAVLFFDAHNTADAMIVGVY